MHLCFRKEAEKRGKEAQTMFGVKKESRRYTMCRMLISRAVQMAGASARGCLRLCDLQ